MTIYAQEIADAKADIESSGVACVLTKSIKTENVTSPWLDSTLMPVTHDVYALLKPTGQLNARTEETRNDKISGSQIALIANYDVLVEPGDYLQVGATSYIVGKVDIIQPDGTPILFKAEIHL